MVPRTGTEVSAGKFLQAFAHGFHAEHEERKASNHF
jgi:hypothetical protein